MLKLVLAVLLITSTFASKLHPLSDEFIASIERQNPKWLPGRNFPATTPLSSIRNLAGARLPKSRNLPTLIHEVGDLPEEFDAREAWPECADVIGEIQDQANCGSCWAVSTAEVISDRICIHSNGSVKVRISAADIMECCTECGQGCYGGWPDLAFTYYNTTGIVTGGKYGSTDGCKPYPIPPCNQYSDDSPFEPCGDIQQAPSCDKSCDSSSIVYENDFRRGSSYVLNPTEEQMRAEIFKNGPIVATYAVNEDFLSYKSGVYHFVSGDFLGMHAIKILGWGVEDGTPYWLVANSWNEYWGDKGYFKILRGSNESFIERYLMASIPSFVDV